MPTAAVASARVAYQMWKDTYSGDRWQALADAGVRVQKPLWASTIEAFRDHGKVADTVENDVDGQRRILERMEAVGVSMQQVTDELVNEGVKKFVEPFDALIAALEDKRKSLTPTGA